MIRLAVPDDLYALQLIETAAGEPFRDIGMDAVANDPPPSLDELTTYLGADHIWVMTDAANTILGYAIVEIIDVGVHIEQVSVHPAHSHNGFGAQLIDCIADWAAAHHHDVMTLTTFVDVPWNAPYYERLGFERIPESALSPDLVRVRVHEQASGLDSWPRITMSRPTLRRRPSTSRIG